ncbi:hypothetical protein [Helicobacter canis]|uniref:Uncharacterized protein n=1 Tax=Helicobacter canis NCTC 12740 TaxID=1357399 RepID=V8CJR0_9HELI|nr:hypothetical protein [Helicobacter canis]ETD27332.1 hypothetical protein HMPREF2087_00244 [Helicobacter canis NCTC 12740]
MIFIQTSHTPLEQKDLARNCVNILLSYTPEYDPSFSDYDYIPQTNSSGMTSVPMQSTPQQESPAIYKYLSYLYDGTDLREQNIKSLIATIYAKAKLEAFDLETLKAIKRAEINAHYENTAQAILVSQYPPSEAQTWSIQEKEAKEWQANNSAKTPFLTQLAKSRGIEKRTLALNVLDKAKAYTTEIAKLTGRRQKCEDEIEAARDISTLDSITLYYSII